MRHRAFRFFLCLAAVCVAALWPSPSFAATAKDRYIKVVGVEGKVLNLDVDGKPVKIPLPEGYEVMQGKELEKTYAHITNTEKELGNLLLCILINSQDVQKKKSGEISDGYTIFRMMIYSGYLNERFSNEQFLIEKNTIKEEHKDGFEWSNSELIKQGLSPFSDKKIFENEKLLSFLSTENYASNGKFKIGYTSTYFIADSIVIGCLFKKNMYLQDDINVVIEDTMKFIEKIGRR